MNGLHDEAERLNEHIQNLLDATRIKTDGIRPRIEWVDPGDIVNAALDHKAGLLAKHRLAVKVVPDLPLVRTDPALIEKALGQLLENAAKYSSAGSVIEVRIEQRDAMVRIAVRDQGAGFAPDEREMHLGAILSKPAASRPDRRLRARTLDRARLASACGAEVDAYSAGPALGATFSSVAAGASESRSGSSRGIR